MSEAEGGSAAASATPAELAAARRAAIAASLAPLKDVKNREVLEAQWDAWLASRKVRPPTRFDAEQRRQLLKFFQVMDADGGGTIDADELVRAGGWGAGGVAAARAVSWAWAAFAAVTARACSYALPPHPPFSRSGRSRRCSRRAW
jgi:hypothetical protein